MTEIDLSEIEGDQRSDAAVQAELAEREAEQRTKTAEIRERIEAGESTGDVLKDLVIVRTNRLDSEIVELYRDLSARVAAHVGEPVLVVTCQEERTSFGGPGAHEKGRWMEGATLGVLTAETLVLDVADGKWAFPTDRYASMRDRLGGDPEVADGPLGTEVNFRFGGIGTNPYEGALGTVLQPEYRHFDLGDGFKPIELEVFVGDAEIAEYLARDLDSAFDGQPLTRRYNELAKLLDLPERPKLSREEFYRKSVEREERAADGSED